MSSSVRYRCSEGCGHPVVFGPPPQGAAPSCALSLHLTPLANGALSAESGGVHAERASKWDSKAVNNGAVFSCLTASAELCSLWHELDVSSHAAIWLLLLEFR